MALNTNQPHRKLSQPGWAGELDDDEMAYLQQKLERSQRLRKKWGYLGAIFEGVSIPMSTLRRIAKHGLR